MSLRMIATAAVFGLSLPVAAFAATVTPTMTTNGAITEYDYGILAGMAYEASDPISLQQKKNKIAVEFIVEPEVGSLAIDFINDRGKKAIVKLGTSVLGLSETTIGILNVFKNGELLQSVEFDASADRKRFKLGKDKTAQIIYAWQTNEGGQVSSNVDSEDDLEGVSAVPLPASGLLLIAGMGGIAALRKRKS